MYTDLLEHIMMKKNAIGKILLIGLLTICLSCQKESCSDNRGEYLTISDFGCQENEINLKKEYNNSYYIIEDSIMFNEYVDCKCNPQIDFSKYTMIIGNKSFTNGTHIESMKMKENCFRIKLEVVFDSRGLTDVAPILLYHAIIYKPINGQSIKVKEKVIE